MKIKDITLSIFAIIGFFALVTSFTNEPENEVGTYQISASGSGKNARIDIFILNTKTGDVRKTSHSEITKEWILD